ncbi:hypothetical protein V6N13_104352 [Hibiscus sabdariffa]|uniref:SPX domain-containing protein n=1 Tax=Hibiscus sabdariffa TaxID=183260 RepID=A0ABR2DI32_9ROSI
MVKFSKELEAQLIPEWKDAFVKYWQLKKHVKKIKLSRDNKQPASSHDLSHEKLGRSIFDPIRFVAMKVASCSSSLFLGSSINNITSEIIQVKSKRMDSDKEDVIYQTELIQLFSEEDEMRVFFESLDGELNKVNQFYKTKESEFLERGEILNKQLQILLDLKQIVADRRQKPLLQPSSTFFSASRRSDSFSGQI